MDTAKPEAPKPTQRSLVRKIAEIMGEITRIPKSGRNEFHKYSYATEADVTEAVRMGMSKRALAMLPDVEKSEFSQLGKMRLATLTVAFTLEDGDSGETRVIHVVGEGTDQGDKASYKAMTGAVKYALMKLFLIPTGDDPERDDPRAPPDHSPPPSPLSRQSAPAPKAAERKMPPIKDGDAPSATPDHFARILTALQKYNVKGKDAAELISSATGKADRKTITEDDVARVEVALQARAALKDSEPQPKDDGDVPF